MVVVEDVPVVEVADVSVVVPEVPVVSVDMVSVDIVPVVPVIDVSVLYEVDEVSVAIVADVSVVASMFVLSSLLQAKPNTVRARIATTANAFFIINPLSSEFFSGVKSKFVVIRFRVPAFTSSAS